MDFKQLRSFVAVADCGSFTQAAAQLYTSQPTISAHIRQLEEELQQRLFLRTTKSLSITPHGRELYDYAVQVLSLQDRLLAGWRQGEQRRLPRRVHHPLGLSPARPSGPLQRSAPGHLLRHPPERQLRRAPRAAHRPVRPRPHRHDRAGRRLGLHALVSGRHGAHRAEHAGIFRRQGAEYAACRALAVTPAPAPRGMAAAASAPPTEFLRAAGLEAGRRRPTSPHG